MRIGLTFQRTFPSSEVVRLARLAEDDGLDDVWIIEDCFFTSGPSLAAAALTATQRVRVGIGILPAVVRHPASTAMEFPTLAGSGPGAKLALGEEEGAHRRVKAVLLWLSDHDGGPA